MAISSVEYIALCEAQQHIMPKLAPLITVDYFWVNMNELRSYHKKIQAEFDYFCQYPRANTRALMELIELMEDICRQTEVVVNFIFPKSFVLSEQNWADYRKTNQVARYYFSDIEITKLIDIRKSE